MGTTACCRRRLGGMNELFRSVFDQVADFGPEWMSDRIGGKDA